MEQWILMAMAPVFLGLIALEAWYWRRRDPTMYSLVDTFSNAGLALMHQAADAVAWALVIVLFYAVHRYRLFDIGWAWWAWIACFILDDLAYYVFHRCAHRVDLDSDDFTVSSDTSTHIAPFAHFTGSFFVFFN